MTGFLNLLEESLDCQKYPFPSAHIIPRVQLLNSLLKIVLQAGQKVPVLRHTSRLSGCRFQRAVRPELPRLTFFSAISFWICLNFILQNFLHICHSPDLPTSSSSSCNSLPLILVSSPQHSPPTSLQNFDNFLSSTYSNAPLYHQKYHSLSFSPTNPLPL